MDAFRRQANKLRDQVAKQQQAVIKQFSASGYESSDAMVIDEVELQRHQQLEKLYRSTRAAKDFQKDIIKALEALAIMNSKHVEVGTKLSEDCYKYGGENMSNEGNLAKAASFYGGALAHMEREYEDLNKLLSSQIVEPLKAMVTGAPLEDARHLAQRYSRMRHEAEQMAAEISRRQARVRESPIAENTTKLQASEIKMKELKSNMAILGKEATTALSAVEAQQQRLTYQRIISMVEAEKSFHLRLAAILDDVEAEMNSEKQRKDSALPSAPSISKRAEKTSYFLAEATHHFAAASERELSLAAGDYVVVRQVNPAGWSEGECKGKAGWFPSSYVERRQTIPTNKVFSHEF